MQSRLPQATLRLATALVLVTGSEAIAQAQTTETLGIDEIIVTARRVEESLQDVPISMSVLEPGQIADRNIVVAADLATYTPSLSVNQRYGPEKSAFAIRGFNQDQSTAPTVGVYFADVVGVRAQGGTTSGNTVGAGAFTDLQNVQVLKAPQGTLFGRNTTGGAILLVPQKPQDEFGGYLEATGGDFDMRRVQAAFNVPVTESFRLRLAADSNQRDGYMRNRSGIGPEDYNDVNYDYVRLGALWDITANLENYLIGHYSKSETNGYASHYAACSTAFGALGTFMGPLACGQIARAQARGDDEYDVDVSNRDPRTLLETWQLINTTTWSVSDNLTIKNILSYGEFTEKSHFNLYSDNFSFPATVPIPPLRNVALRYIELDEAPDGAAASEYTATEELQFQGSVGDGQFIWVAGAYLEFSRPIGWNYQRTGIALSCTDVTTLNCTDPLRAISPAAPVGTVSNSRTQFEFDNHGIFGQGTYNFSDQWALTLGLRYTFDKIVGTGESTRFVYTTPTVTRQFCNDTVRFKDPGQPDKTVTDPSQCSLTLETKSEEPTWLLGVDYKPTDDVLVYGKYSRGYRQGGLSFTNIGLETWDPEQVDAYEVGSKFSFSGGSASGYINAAVFYNDFQDQQIFASTIAAGGSGAQAGAAVIVNAGESVIQGFELDSTLVLFENLRLDIGYTYLDTELKSLIPQVPPPGSPFVAINPSATVGAPLTLSPEHRVSATATYTLPLDESIGAISFGVTYVFTDEQIANGSVPAFVTNTCVPGAFVQQCPQQIEPAALGVIPSTDIVNVNLNWNGIFGTRLDAAAFVTNANDETYAVNTGGGWNSAGVGDLLMGAPRMYGVRVRYSFGE